MKVIVQEITAVPTLMHWRSEVVESVFGVAPSKRLLAANRRYYGSVENQWGYAYRLAIRKRKNFLSATPLRLARNSLILALNDSAMAFEERWL